MAFCLLMLCLGPDAQKPLWLRLSPIELLGHGMSSHLNEDTGLNC